MKLNLFCICVLVSACAIAGESAAIKPGVSSSAFEKEEKKAADKSRYNLFNPTPREQMREMSTDRPDKTESPYTVDAGHFQFETDLASYSIDRENPERSDERVKSLAIMPVNFKIGLTNRIDIQFVFETYNIVHTRGRNEDGIRTSEYQDGFGDITTRLKINVFGNDEGSRALAVMPYIKAPTNQDNLGNNKVEGGLIIPFGMDLPHGFSMGVMHQTDLLWDDDDNDYYAQFVHTITFGHDIIGNLGGYVEFFSAFNTRGTPWEGTADVGFTYGFTDDIQLDFGCNFGVTRSAEDFNPFVGLSIRF
ncbi:MAG TPA: transporter [Planctomycetota bacterium]|nr:transporter [Planctomycetota bacterium]